ncbi:SWI/SNF chromatin-remodeling complex subunit, partial [Coemansia sp. RSA 486]
PSQLLRQWVHGAIEGQLVTPEQVSRVICGEKRLGGEFETAIAHAIREQLYAFVKSFLLAGYAYRPHMMPRKQALAQAQASRQRLIQIDDKELARSVLPPVVRVERDQGATQTFAPLIAHLHTVDAERLEKDSERETRRKRRQGRGRGRAGAGAAAAGPTPVAGAYGGGGGALMLLPPDREVHRTNRTMIPLPSWFDDELPPDTRSFVETPGEGAHFLDSYEMRAVYEAQSLATVVNGSAPAAIAALGSAGGGVAASAVPSAGASAAFGLGSSGAFDHSHSLSPGVAGAGIDDLGGLRRGASLAFGGSGGGAGLNASSQLLGRRYASGSASTGGFLSTLDIGGSVAAGSHYGIGAAASSSPSMMGAAQASSAPSTPVSPMQAVREKLRNPTGRPRGRPSILEKSLRDASNDRMMRMAKAGGEMAANAQPGAVPGQLTGRPLEELIAKWRCMCCGLPPDRTPMIRRGPESMHSLCDECGQVYADQGRLRDVGLATIRANMARRCGKLVVPRTDEVFFRGPDVSSPGSPLPQNARVYAGAEPELARESTAISTEDDGDSKDFSLSDDMPAASTDGAVVVPAAFAPGLADTKRGIDDGMR